MTTTDPPARPGDKVTSGPRPDALKLAALRALLRATHREEIPLSLAGQENALRGMLLAGRTPDEIADGLAMSVDTVIAALWRLSCGT